MVDATSFKILQILQDKARIPNVEVARQVEMAPSAVLERIRKMERQGVIDGYEVRLNPEKFKRSQIAFVFVRVEAGGIGSRVGESLSLVPDVQEVHYVSGEDAFLIKIRVASSGALGQLLLEKINTIEGVLSTKSFPVLSTMKETARIPIEPTVPK